MQVMVDVEAFGTDSFGLITQIGGLYFDEDKKNYDMFVVNVNINDSLDNGFKVTGDTLKWWFERKPTFLKNTVSVSKALQMFKDFLKPALKKEMNIWAHSFDYKILSDAYYLIKQKLPFSYRQTMDIRTLTTLTKNLGMPFIKVNECEKTHDALDDCKYQVIYVCNCLKYLKEGKYNVQ